MERKKGKYMPLTQEVAVDLIDEDPRLQIRKTYNKETLRELGYSLEQEGALYPLLLKRGKKGRFTLILGSRRLRAAKLRGIKTLPAYVREEIKDIDIITLMLHENIQREELTPFEEAQGFYMLATEFGLSNPQIASRVGKEEGYVLRRLKFLSLTPRVQKKIAKRELNIAHIGILAKRSPEEQEKLLKEVEEHNLSEEETNLLVQRTYEKKPFTSRKPPELTPLKISLRMEGYGRSIDDLIPSIKKMEQAERKELLKEFELLAKKVHYIINHILKT